MDTSRLPAPTLLALVTAAPLVAQTPLHVHAVDNGNDGFGASAAGLGDVNGDGVPDYAFGAPFTSVYAGYVPVFSGATGEILFTLEGQVGLDGDRFGDAIAGIGDVDGDQVPDVLVGAPYDDTYAWNGGRAGVYSGSSGVLLREYGSPAAFVFGASTGRLGDVDGDGLSEYLIGVGADSGGTSTVRCFSGATGLPLWTFANDGHDLATRLSPVVGDGNGDGVPDALVGAPGQPSGLGIQSGNFVAVVDGSTGEELLRVTGATYDQFGHSVSWLGDLDGDGGDEFAVYAIEVPDEERISVFDGSTGALLYRTSATCPTGLGSVSGVGDQDGDGAPDFAAQHGGDIVLHSGATGGPLHTYDGFPTKEQNVAVALAPGGDLDGDGRDELLLGSRSAWPSGVSVVYSSRSYPFEDVGGALAAPPFGEPVLTAESALTGGSVLRATLSNALDLHQAYLVIGYSSIDLPLLGGVLVPSPDVVLGGIVTGGPLSPWGHEFQLTLPQGISAVSEIYLQYWIVQWATSPQPFSASNAVRGIVP